MEESLVFISDHGVAGAHRLINQRRFRTTAEGSKDNHVKERRQNAVDAVLAVGLKQGGKNTPVIQCIGITATEHGERLSSRLDSPDFEHFEHFLRKGMRGETAVEDVDRDEHPQRFGKKPYRPYECKRKSDQNGGIKPPGEDGMP